jgi:hypothetical protein
VNIQVENRPKLVVLDANFSWTRNLFSSLAHVADILLLYPKDFRAFKKEYGSHFIDWKPVLVSPGIWQQRICLPPGWLFNYWPLTEIFLAGLIKRFTGNKPCMLVFVYPYYAGLSRKLSASSVYYNMDEYKHYWPGRERSTEKVELQAVQTADLTLCTAWYRAQQLIKKLPEEAHKIIHIPHGASEQFIASEVLNRPLPVSDRYHRPVVGYIGALNFRFDFHYLYEVALSMPEVTFLLGGKMPTPAEGDEYWFNGYRKIKELSNVYFIGFIPNKDISNLISSFDALILPYARCDFNLNACPMKLWDYMGTSVPMVANDVVPEINLWSEVIQIASDAKSFSNKLRFAIDNRLWKAEERINIARQNTWRMQADKLLTAWQSKMKEKSI